MAQQIAGNGPISKREDVRSKLPAANRTYFDGLTERKTLNFLVYYDGNDVKVTAEKSTGNIVVAGEGESL